MVASGPCCPDISTAEQARHTVRKYGLKLSPQAEKLLGEETPKVIENAENHITGSVAQLCRAAAEEAGELGYRPFILTDRLCCEAAEAGSFLASCAGYYSGRGEKLALIAGGETVVHLRGDGLGGRNQELVLSAAAGISGLENVLIFSLGSDGTDGPTDAAGAMADGSTWGRLRDKGMDAEKYLMNNDSYTALKAADSLIMTGPTGTNVNDLSVVLIG